ncbi:hypothetical protein P691DRAFT_68495 [Macrolepiota fuliginosa MF-IS2]|uniref:Uncharacterized protein n=1 Tax=Macrolepiota fuliginosa MF-IS2 TaxID=1400762 RepID=A0A9P5WZV9_9AGAR|nr:hypothetical protein P691DRAFT_68495 [Macrolepiota fuliginosa MF-IS2]
MSDHVLKHVSVELWKIWGHWVTEAVPWFYQNLRYFNFAIHHNTGFFSQTIWANTYNATPSITHFLCELNTWQAEGLQHIEYAILRTEPSCSTDEHLIHEYGHLINYQGMSRADFGYILSDATGWGYICLSLEAYPTGLHDFSRMHKALLNPDPMYFLLGYDTNTCLVIAYRPAMGIQQFFQDAFRQIRDLHPDDIGSKTEWPTKGDLEVLISASETPQGFLDQAYLPSLARTIVAFVGHPDYADPVGRLRWVMEILNQNHDPMEFLELLHSRSLLDIPRSLHLTTSHVLAFLACYGVRSHSHAIPATFISHFLGLAEASVKQVLRLASLVLSSRPLPFPMDAISNFDLSDLSEYLRGNLVYIQSGGRDEQPSPAVSSQAWLEVSARYIYWCDHVLATDGASTGGLYRSCNRGI